MTLHEEIVEILKTANTILSTKHIAAEVNRRKNYVKPDGSPVSDFQIHGRTKNYPKLFLRNKSLVGLVGRDEENIFSQSASKGIPLKEDVVKSNLNLESISISQEQLEKHFFNILDITRDNNPQTLESNLLILTCIFIKRVFESSPDNIILPSLKEYDKFKDIVKDNFYNNESTKVQDEFYGLVTELFSANNIPIPNYFLWSQLSSLERLIKDLVFYLDGISFQNDSVNQDQFGLAFNNFIENMFAGQQSEFATPWRIKKLMVELLKVTPSDNIYDPAVGVGGFFITIKDLLNTEQHLEIKSKYYGQEISSSVYCILLMNMLLNRISIKGFHVGDSLTEPKYCYEKDLVKFDKIISDIPWGLKITRNQTRRLLDRLDLLPTLKLTSEEAFIIHSIHLLHDHGKAVFAFHQGFLSDKKYYELRKGLIDIDYLEGIIRLPQGSHFHSLIYPIIVVINKTKKENQKNKMMFIDLEHVDTTKNEIGKAFLHEIANSFHQFEEKDSNYKIIDHVKIKNNNYSLNTNIYYSLGEELNALLISNEAKRIKDLFKISRGIAKAKLKNSSDEHSASKFISIKDLSNEITQLYIDTSKLDEVFYNNDKERINYKSILISLIGSKLKPSIYDPVKVSTNDKIYYDRNIICLIPRDNSILLEYAFYQFYSTEVLKQIDQVRKSSAMPSISISNIEKIIIPLPSIDEQRKYIDDQKRTLLELERLRYQERIKDLELKKSEIIGQEETIRILSHNLYPKISNINTIINSFESYFTKNGLSDARLYDVDIRKVQDDYELLNETVPVSSSETIEQTIERCRGYLRYIEGLITKTKEYVLLKLNDEDFDRIQLDYFLEEFIADKKAEYKSLYKFKLKCPNRYLVDIHVPTFKELFNQLVINTHVHAFKSDEAGQRIIEIRVSQKEDKGFITFSNNGKKFDLTEDEYFGLGKKGSKSSGMGLGGYHIKRIVEEHKGTLQIDMKSKGFKLIMHFPRMYRIYGGRHGGGI